jgi:hypothetical protein
MALEADFGWRSEPSILEREPTPRIDPIDESHADRLKMRGQTNAPLLKQIRPPAWS